MTTYNEISQKTDMYFLVLNICVSIIFVVLINKKIQETLVLDKYVLTRTTRITVLFMHLKKCTVAVAPVFLSKIIADVLTSQLNIISDCIKLFWYGFSMALTILIWILFLHLLQATKIQSKYIQFIFLVFLVVAQYASLYIPIFTIFVAGSVNYYSNPILWITGKVILSIMLVMSNILAYRKHETLK